jgi:release factor glutamine methyltransferase
MPELVLALGTLIEDGAERLRRSRIAEPRRQAVRIWSELTAGDSAEVFLRREAPVEAPVVAHFNRAIERRAKGEPLPHVTGWSGFRKLSLRSDGRALIPRPETEGLVDLVLERAPSGRVADVGTGSGCIALSLAAEGNYSDVVGVDCSSAALRLAQQNRELVSLPATFVQADLCGALRAASLDALVSNPPYLTAAEYASLDESVRSWEPEVALVSGSDGMDVTRRLLTEGRDVVRPGGWIALEVDRARARATGQLAAALAWSDVSVHTDLFGRERYLLARRSDTR